LLRGKNKISISDYLTFNGNHKATFYFHLEEGVASFQVDNKIVLERDNKQLTLYFEADCDYSVKITNDTISPSYGIILNSETICLSMKFVNSFNLVTNICF